MKLEVGQKYRLAYWSEDKWFEVLDIGISSYWTTDELGNKTWYHNDNSDFLPYSEPALDDTLLWYWEVLDDSDCWSRMTVRMTEDVAKKTCERFSQCRKLEALGSIRRED